MPVLGLYHGNRLEELAQLYREDVRLEDGVWVLKISDEGERRLKNEQSARTVPLRSELIRLGFLEHVAQASKPTDRVFSDLVPGGKDRKLGYGFTKRFAAYRKAIGLQRKGLDFQSFRHGLHTKLFAADVNPGWIDLLTGRESGSEGQRRYLKPIRPSILRTALEKVTWPEMDLSGLYVREAGDENPPADI